MNLCSATELPAFAEMNEVNGLVSYALVIFDIKIGSPIGDFQRRFILIPGHSKHNTAIQSALIYLDEILLEHLA